MRTKITLILSLAAIISGCATSSPKVVIPEPITLPHKPVLNANEKISFIGYYLNEELSGIKECKIKEGTLSRWNGRGIEFEYDIFYDKEKCFQRRSDHINKSREINNEWVQVMNIPRNEHPFYLHIPTITIVNKKIAEISVLTTGLESQEIVFRDLQNKYGTPKLKSNTVEQNRLGTKFDVINAAWVLKNGIEIIFVGTTDTIKYGKIVISTEEGRNYQDKINKEKEAKRPKI